jgi:cell division protein ZapA
MKADKPSQVQVEIFGQSYSVRAGTDPGYVERLARHVDAQMQEVGKASGAVDSLRVAVLAALNIADELFQAREKGGDAEKRASQRAAEAFRARLESLTRELDAVLGDSR